MLNLAQLGGCGRPYGLLRSSTRRVLTGSLSSRSPGSRVSPSGGPAVRPERPCELSCGQPPASRWSPCSIEATGWRPARPNGGRLTHSRGTSCGSACWPRFRFRSEGNRWWCRTPTSGPRPATTWTCRSCTAAGRLPDGSRRAGGRPGSVGGAAGGGADDRSFRTVEPGLSQRFTGGRG